MSYIMRDESRPSKKLYKDIKLCGHWESNETGPHDRRMEFNKSEHFILDLGEKIYIHNSFTNHLDHSDKKVLMAPQSHRISRISKVTAKMNEVKQNDHHVMSTHHALHDAKL